MMCDYDIIEVTHILITKQNFILDEVYYGWNVNMLERKIVVDRGLDQLDKKEVCMHKNTKQII